jgi:anti-anti-sigma factor
MIPPRGMHTLVLIGDLNRASAHTLEAEIERLCEAGTSGITLDLSKLTSIDSIGVAVIAFRSKLCQKRGYDFALIPGPRIIQRAFELAGLTDRLPFQRDTEPIDTDRPTSPVETVVESVATTDAKSSIGSNDVEGARVSSFAIASRHSRTLSNGRARRGS